MINITIDDIIIQFKNDLADFFVDTFQMGESTEEMQPKYDKIHYKFKQQLITVIMMQLISGNKEEVKDENRGQDIN